MGRLLITLRLDSALADPANSIPDQFVTKEGWMWAYRWAKELGVRVNGSAETEPPDWIVHYEKWSPRGLRLFVRHSRIHGPPDT
ncbi:MAG: hypothetical protein ABSB35_35350 [Bryobacteraceae bacterium]